MISFWKWFARGSREGPAGYRNLANKFVIFHLVVAALATFFIKSDGVTFAQKALFPASSILVGLSIAWTTRASTILQTKELRETLFTRDRPSEDYVYGFQLAILLVMIMVIYIAVMAGGGLRIRVFSEESDTFLSAFWMYLLLSVGLRECWGVVNFTNMLSILEYQRPK